MAEAGNPIELIQMVGNPLLSIAKMARKIAQKVEDVKVNKKQCTRLSERIGRIASHLDSHGFKKAIHSYGGALKQTLERFYGFLKECYEFISSFVDIGWIRNFINSKDNKEKFQELNTELGLYFDELSMGMNIKNFADKKQDEKDQAEDRIQLATLINGQQNNIMQARRINQVNVKNEPRAKLRTPVLRKDRHAIYGKRDFGYKLRSKSAENLAVFSSDNIFVNGIWSQRYSKNGVWHGPFKHTMNFNSYNNTFKGQGENDVGQFTVSGTFSKGINQINIIQVYKYGTGNPQLNKGHQCQFQLTWNKEKRVFQGTHYIPTGWTMMPAGHVEMSLVSAA